MKNIYGIFIVVIFLTICYGNPINDNNKRERRQVKDMNNSSTMMQTSRQFIPGQQTPGIQGIIPGIQGTIPVLQGSIPGIYPGNGFQMGFQQIPSNNAFYPPMPANIFQGNIYGNGFLPSGPSNIDVNQLNSAVNFANLPGLTSQNFPQQILQPNLPGNPFLGGAFPQQPFYG